MTSVKNHKRAQALTEYLILVALLGIASMAVVQVLGHNLQTRLADVSDAIRGKTKKREGEEITSKQLGKKDMGDFSDAISNTGN